MPRSISGRLSPLRERSSPPATTLQVTSLPLTEIANAATAHRADIVALSFSVAFPYRRIPALLDQLRTMLPESTSLWAGGSGVSHAEAPEGITLMRSLDDGLAALAGWRADHSLR